MLLTIPKWPSAGGLVQYATTWKLTRDLQGSQVELLLTEDTVNLLALENTTVIPTGSIWYISALRHLKDSAGNIVSNTKWIGPKPIINDNSNVSDHLAPEFIISKPYIKNLNYNPGTGLDCTLIPVEGNVGYKNTLVTITDRGKRTLLNKVVDLTTSQSFSISNNEVNFALHNTIQITIINIGNHSTISSPYVETINLKDVYYRVIGNTTNLDPKTLNTLVFENSTTVPVTVVGAEVLNLNGVLIDTCTVVNSNVTLPLILEFGDSYNVSTTLSYKDSSNNVITFNESIYVTIRNNDEEIPVDSNFKYKNDIIKVKEIPLTSTDNKIDTTHLFNSEEFFTNLTPVPSSSGDIDLFIFDKETNLFNTAKSAFYNINTNFSIRLFTKTNGVVQVQNGTSLELRFFKYDSYKDIITIIHTVTLPIIGLHPEVNKISFVGGKFYLTGVSTIDSKNIVIYEVTMGTGGVAIVHTETTTTPLTDVSVAPYKSDSLIITPFNGTRLKVYNVATKSFKDSLAIPSNFISKAQFSAMLNNGNIFNIRISEILGVLDFFIIDIYNNNIITKSIPYNSGGSIRNMIKLKNGSILLTTANSTKKMIFELV